MSSLINKSIAAISITIVRENLGEISIWEGKGCVVENYLNHQIQLLPVFIRLPFKVFVCFFALSSVLNGGFFHQLSPKRRSEIMGQWRLSPFGPKRDFIRLFDVLAAYCMASISA